MGSRLSAQEYEELIGQTVDLLTVVDESGTILYESPSVEHVLGFERGHFEGTNAFELIHPADRQRALDTFYEAIEAEEDFTTRAVEVRLQKKDGSWIWVESRGSNRTSSALEGHVIVSRNISARKESEQQLQRERDRLDRFASVVSHDLRNPLNVIQGQVELAQEDCESEHLEAVERSADRMEELIEGVLTLAQGGNAVLETEAVQLDVLAERCWRTVDTKEAALDVGTAQPIQADQRQSRQLFENLFRNAIEHGDDDVTITVDVLPDGFYVEDDGRGISEDAQEDLLEHGFSTKSNGTGFGLSIVSEIVDAHDWDLHISEGEDGGARFEVRNVTLG